jgi:hypothetical protein
MTAVFGLVIYLANKSDGAPTNNGYAVPDNLFQVPSRLKFKANWFSDDYVTPYFYHNGWIPLLSVIRPILDDDDYEIENISYSLGSGNFDYEKKRWATVGDCLKHNHEVRKELKQRLKEQKEERLRRENRKREAYKRANS